MTNNKKNFNIDGMDVCMIHVHTLVYKELHISFKTPLHI